MRPENIKYFDGWQEVEKWFGIKSAARLLPDLDKYGRAYWGWTCILYEWYPPPGFLGPRYTLYFT